MTNGSKSTVLKFSITEDDGTVHEASYIITEMAQFINDQSGIDILFHSAQKLTQKVITSYKNKGN